MKIQPSLGCLFLRACPTAIEHMDVFDISGDFTHIPAKAIALPFTKSEGIFALSRNDQLSPFPRLQGKQKSSLVK